MKKLTILLLIIYILSLTSGCSPSQEPAQVVATTLPVYDFTSLLCAGTNITVKQLITENLSCLHDYTLQVDQMKAIEGAQVVILSGAGLEEFLEDALTGANEVVDTSEGISLLCGDHHDHEGHDHHHESDPHIWLDINNARKMAQNICEGLVKQFPAHEQAIRENMRSLNDEFNKLEAYGKAALSELSCRKLITFHDGFAYFAECYDLTILKALEEESGSEASAAELKDLIGLVRDNHLPAIFTEVNGSTAAASIVAAETGISVCTLNMAMSGSGYFEAMYQNINTIKEALG